MRAEGYGADVEFDGQTITIYAGKVAAKLQGTPVVRVPVADVVDVTVRSANPLVNGELRLDVGSPRAGAALGELVRLAKLPTPEAEAAGRQLGDDVAAWITRLHSYGQDQPNRVNPESLVVHWRRKDQAAFTALVDAIRAAVPAPAV